MNGLRSDIAVLVVDDDVTLRETVAFEFKMIGLKVLEAGDGNEALEVIKSNKVDMIVSDIRMPNRNGIELLDYVRQTMGPSPPLIFISGFADIPVWETFARGAEGFFGKPFDIEKIVERVQLLIAPKNLKWSINPGNPKNNIHLVFKSHEHAASNEGFSVGRGGIFLGNIGNRSFRKDDSIGFKLEVFGSAKLIEGIGVVRWVRSTPHQGQPTGYGIEFKYIAPEVRQKLIQLIEEAKPIAYIPRGPTNQEQSVLLKL